MKDASASQNTTRTSLPVLHKAKSVAIHLGVSRSKAYQMMKNNEIPWVRVGRRSIRVPDEALRKWIAERTIGGDSQG